MKHPLTKKLSVLILAILLIAVLTFVIWMLVGGEEAFTHALLTSITVLVIVLGISAVFAYKKIQYYKNI